MVAKRNIYLPGFLTGNPSPPPGDDNKVFGGILLIGFGLFVVWLFLGGTAFADASLPSGGGDAVGKLKAAGSLLSIVDTALFKWGARIFAGLCIMSAGWALKEQRFGVAIVCVIGAILVGTAPSWVKNIFEISGGDSVFGYLEPKSKPAEGASLDA
jgi:hypothetical protein